MRLGWNDGQDGRTVHCALCDWTTECDHLEQIEFRLGEHLQKVHGKRLRYRRDETGKLTTIPQGDDHAA